ncbi:MAG TPA: hypothetical protein ENH15_01185 [Actinobacteria bacterium]|nr:hypothetical protein [Actinomycetota bacterium]
MLSQMIRAGRLDRNFYSSLEFAGERAVGDAALLVGVAHGVPAVIAMLLYRLPIASALSFVLFGIVAWLISAGGMHLVATRVYEVPGRYETAMRPVGFAQVAAIPAALRILPSGLSGLLILGTLIWLFAALVVISQVLYGHLDQQQHMATAAGGVGAWFLATLFFI